MLGDKPRSAPTSPVLNGRKSLGTENHSTGSSIRTNSSGGGDVAANKGIFRANTELGTCSVSQK